MNVMRANHWYNEHTDIMGGEMYSDRAGAYRAGLATV